MDLVLDLPMLTDQAQQLLGTGLVWAKARHSIDHFVALPRARLQSDSALQLEDLGQPRPVTVAYQRRTSGQPALLDAAMPAVARLRGGQGLRPLVGFLED
jgi:hypothetical protein